MSRLGRGNERQEREWRGREEKRRESENKKCGWGSASIRRAWITQLLGVERVHVQQESQGRSLGGHESSGWQIGSSRKTK
jgi:hypothetical protein